MPDKTKRPKPPAYSKKSPVKSHERSNSLKRGASKSSSRGTKDQLSLFSKLLKFFKL